MTATDQDPDLWTHPAIELTAEQRAQAESGQGVALTEEQIQAVYDYEEGSNDGQPD